MAPADDDGIDVLSHRRSLQSSGSVSGATCPVARTEKIIGNSLTLDRVDTKSMYGTEHGLSSPRPTPRLSGRAKRGTTEAAC